MKKLSKKISHLPLYFYLVYMLIAIVFILGSFLYITKPNRLEPVVLYYHNPSQIKDIVNDIYLPELRNLPTSSMAFSNSLFKYKQGQNIERFIKELLLGPKNIYATQIIPPHIKIDKVFINKKNPTVVFIMLYTKREQDIQKNSSALIMSLEAKRSIYHWLAYNIKEYYSVNTINLLIDGKIIE